MSLFNVIASSMPLLFSFFGHHLKHAGHLQALGASCIVFIAALLQRFPIEPLLVFIPYALFLPIYLNDRFYDFRTAPEADRERSDHIRNYETILPSVIIIVVLASMLSLVFSGHYQLAMYSLFVYAFGFLYPMFFKELTRYIPLFKNFFVAAVFASLIFVPAMYFEEAAVGKLLIVLASYVGFEALIMQILLDLKDSRSDTERGLLTLPAIIGVKSSIVALIILAVGSVFFALLIPGVMLFRWMVSASLVANLVSVWLVGRGGRLPRVCSDGR